MTQATLSRLWESTEDLYARFGLDADSVPPAQRRRYLNEEVLELMEASTLEFEYEFEGLYSYVANEAADVLVTIIGLLQAHGISRESFEAACERVAAKNNAKTEANGYQMIGGKIRKENVLP